MIFLDTDAHYLIADSRRAMVSALLEHLPNDPDGDTLAALAAACLGLADPLEVAITET